MTATPMHRFERELTIAEEEVALSLCWIGAIPWAALLLNPRRLRGSDFLMRWSQGAWSERRIVEALEETGDYFALPYGPSGVAPENDPRAFELYFERLEAAGLGRIKRPDLLIFRKDDRAAVLRGVKAAGGEAELPFTPEPALASLLGRAVVAIECENSLWRAARMPRYGHPLTPQRRLGGQPGLPKSAVGPTIILKQEDLEPLAQWQGDTGVPIHIWHLFYDLAYGLAFDRAAALISGGAVAPTEQVFQSPGGAVTRKAIYKIYYQHAYAVGRARSEPALAADSIEDKNGHILPYVRFQGGRIELDPAALAAIAQESAKQRRRE